MAGNGVQFKDVGENDIGQRIDNYLIKFLKGAPKSLIYRIIRKGEVRVNKKRVKVEYKLQLGDRVRVPPVKLGEKAEIAPLSADFKHILKSATLFECDAFLVINKPSGMAVHAGSGIQVGLIEALRQLADKNDYLELVHRLDRGTSGCILVAKKRSMLKYLQTLLRNDHQIKKEYLALVEGRWPRRGKVVDAPLKRRELANGEHIISVRSDGKPSVTHFSIETKFQDATLVNASPITGRTHQIRVHAQYLGHPLVGDEKYGDDERHPIWRQRGVKRLFLHAHKLTFKLPDGEPFTVTAPLAPELKQVIKNLEAPA